MRQRVAAMLSIVVGVAALVLAIVIAIDEFPRGLILLGCFVLAAVAAWHGILRRGLARWAGLAVAAVALAGAIVVLVTGGSLLAQLLVIAGLLLSLALGRFALHVHVALPRAPAPRHPVLFYNPLSGGGKAKRFDLAAEARKRGMEPVELRRGDDLEQLVRDAVARGADALAMAGGDGSQAVVAAVAAELQLPYACIPAGTRNHFALDLGVDRDDCVGALDAFVDGGERVVDLADVNGRVFVNNVSLGLYAEAVQREGYRDAKLRTLLDTVPDVLGPDHGDLDLRWVEPDGRGHSSGAAVLISNNRYRLGRAIGSGTRPRIDDGLLGIAVVGAGESRPEARQLSSADSPERGALAASRGSALEPEAAAPESRVPARRSPHPWQQWSAPDFEVDADHPVPAGVDGEALVFHAPLRFRIHPGVLHVRIARAHPGASPSALAPDGAWEGLGTLARIAVNGPQAGDAVTAVS